MPLGKLALETAAEIAFHGSRADAFPAAQAAAIDAIQVLLIDGFLERLAGSLAAQDTRHSLAEVTPAAQALRFRNQDLQDAVAERPQSSWRIDRRTQPLPRSREPPQCTQDLGPVYRAEILMIPF
jgi:hypothetical protein